MPTCFLITPIGEIGSDIRKNADDLRDLIVMPVLEIFSFTVFRGDHRAEGQIDMDVIRAIQESDLCIVDLSLPNTNVYYEFGRRDEMGKPLILLKAKGSEDLPVDVATRRYIEYDLDSRRGLIGAREQLKNLVEQVVKKGFEVVEKGGEVVEKRDELNGTSATLAQLVETVRRVERKIDRQEQLDRNKIGQFQFEVNDDNTLDTNIDPTDLLNYALAQKNIPLAERAMRQLSYRTEYYRWLDLCVEQVAAIGSNVAGNLLIENAFAFIDKAESLRKKIEYIGCLVSYLNRTDRELENLGLIEKLCNGLKLTSENENVQDRVQIYNQLNRLYHGIYSSTNDEQWLEKAINELREALSISEDENYLHYNLAMCLQKRNKDGDMEEALQHILRCLDLDDGEMDADHIETACEIMYTLGDDRISKYLDILGQINPIKLTLLRSRLKKASVKKYREK